MTLSSVLGLSNVESHVSEIRTLKQQYWQENTRGITPNKKMVMEVFQARKKSD
jgi:hypothetical protein